MAIEYSDVLIIGAGPSGALAAYLLVNRGYRVTVLEKTQFPRFSIGESLLPQSTELLEQAGMLDVIKRAKFQLKNGAAFTRGTEYCDFDFSNKFSHGHSGTYQVQRSSFDQLLAQSAEDAGARIHYQHEIIDVKISVHEGQLTAKDNSGNQKIFCAKFVLDASGFGRVLPRVLSLEVPSGFPIRHSVFTHVEDRIDDVDYDREKILIAIHPDDSEVWYWLIPFSNGRASLGIVAKESILDSRGDTAEKIMHNLIAESHRFKQLLGNARFDTPIRKIGGYSAKVSSLVGPGWALLGNAGEFLDPVFSSGVTIALKSATLAADVLDRQLSGQSVDWKSDYADVLQQGIDTFRVYVDAWYDGRFQDIIFHKKQNPDVKAMVCSILAGYVWDQKNPFVKNPQRKLNTLAQLCAI